MRLMSWGQWHRLMAATSLYSLPGSRKHLDDGEFLIVSSGNPAGLGHFSISLSLFKILVATSSGSFAPILLHQRRRLADGPCTRLDRMSGSWKIRLVCQNSGG